jgi:hypothetical protein
MAEPITIGVAVITGLVGAYKAYTEYKAAVVKAQAEQKPEPDKSEEAAKGQQVADIVKAGVEQHGNEDERTDLANFERNPQRYQDGLVTVLRDIADREPAFAGQLQTLAQQANIQTGGIQGTATASDQARVYGTVAGVNTGTISGTYNVDDEDDEDNQP